MSQPKAVQPQVGKSLSGSKKKECEMIFKLYDENKDGRCSMMELNELFRSCGAPLLDKELIDITEIFESRINNSDFTLKQFLEIFTEYYRENETVDDLLKAFQYWDKNNTGKISRYELRKSLTSLGETLNEEEIEVLLKEADPNDTGEVDYVKYANILMQTY